MTSCRACGSRHPAKLFTKDKFDILRCASCELHYTDSDPDVDSLRSLYGEGYFQSKGAGTSYFNYIAEESAMRVNAEKRLAAIGKIKPHRQGARLLDVGCATGVFLESARPLWDVSGVELSAFASDYARRKKGLPVRTGTLKETAYPAAHFDVVTMWDVIEHLPSPAEDLAEVARVIRDDGLLVLTTGDVSSIFARICGRHWHLYNPAQHLSFFSPGTIETLLNRAGFTVLRVGREGSYFTLSYLASSLAMYYPSGLTKAVYKAIGNTRAKDLRFCVNLGDIITVYARKTARKTTVLSF